MLFRTRGGTAAITLLASAAALSFGFAGASCASQGQGTNETFTDGSADGTQEESGSSSGASGSSSGSTSGSSSGAAGCDADIMGDPFNCGSCGHHCPQGNNCSCGTCLAPCSGGMATCCGGCADLTKDPMNCGTCNNACQSLGTGDIPECVSGHCSFTCPEAGAEGGALITCGADSGSPGCFDPSTSPQACGGCGIVCASGSCAGGICQDASVPTTGYTSSTPTLPFIDACSLPNSKSVLPMDFSWTVGGVQPLPFPFTFFGTAETQFWIGSQGTVAFGSNKVPPFQMQPDSFPSCSMGDPTTNYPAIVAFGDTNLETGSAGICWAVNGAPDAGGDGGAGAQLVVTWKQASLANEPGSELTFSIVLTQGTGTIDFIYETALNGPDGGLDPTVEGANASVGMQLNATTNTVYSCNQSLYSATPFTVRFTPH